MRSSFFLIRHRALVAILSIASILLFSIPSVSFADLNVNQSVTITACIGDACNSGGNSSGGGTTTGGGGGGGVSGGGGGGGDLSTGLAQVVFKGKAYPRSIVTILKGAQVVLTTPAGQDASFQATVSNIASGNHIFSIYSEDARGNRSSLLTFPVSVTGNAITNVTGVFISPTIATDKAQVKQGDPIVFFGQTLPASSVTIEVNSEEPLFVSAKAATDGTYLYQFNSGLLEKGDHSVKSTAEKTGELSTYSKSIAFTVGNTNVLAQSPATTDKPLGKVDVNNDKKVNLIDFSILAYWYKRPSPLATVDFNKDGKVDLKDFSILAYNWTG